MSRTAAAFSWVPGVRGNLGDRTVDHHIGGDINCHATSLHSLQAFTFAEDPV